MLGSRVGSSRRHRHARLLTCPKTREQYVGSATGAYTCSIQTRNDCAIHHGIYRGDNTVCGDSTCPAAPPISIRRLVWCLAIHLVQ